MGYSHRTVWVGRALQKLSAPAPGLVIHPALLKVLGLCEDMGTKISFYLQIDQFIFISLNRVTPPECPSHFINRRLRKFKNMYIDCVLSFFELTWNYFY